MGAKIYRTITEVLMRMVVSGEITKAQNSMLYEAHELERVEWRNRMVKLVGIAYDAGRRHDTMDRQALVDEIVRGGWDA